MSILHVDEARQNLCAIVIGAKCLFQHVVRKTRRHCVCRRGIRLVRYLESCTQRHSICSVALIASCTPSPQQCSCRIPLTFTTLRSCCITMNNRVASCWGYQSCSGCIHSSHGCGWCPSSSNCVPVNSLLDPISNASTCPSREERFELRTKALGCGCSTITLLSIIVTVFATIAALILLYGIVVLIRRGNQVLGTGIWRGTGMEIKDDGSRVQREWRRSDSWTTKLISLFRRDRTGSDRSEQEQKTERSRLLG